MKHYEIGIDLGTSSVIIATKEQGVIFRQPTVGAVDTRSNTVIAVGDKALRMVGRAPSAIDIVRPLRDGVIQDHRMTNELILRFLAEVCPSRLIRPRVAVCVPAAITGVEADAVVESVMAAGAKQGLSCGRTGGRGARRRAGHPHAARLHGHRHRRRLHRYRRHQHGRPRARRQPAGGGQCVRQLHRPVYPGKIQHRHRPADRRNAQKAGGLLRQKRVRGRHGGARPFVGDKPPPPAA